MKLIVGLGNPGKVYIDSRHNFGFAVVTALAKNYGISFKKEALVNSLIGKGEIGTELVVLAMPQTYMNLSGIAVKALLKKFNIDSRLLLAVCDDLDLDFGRLKIKDKGSSGGHRGIQSIIDELGSRDFCRLRLGIGRPLRDGQDVSEYVLSPFAKSQKVEVQEMINLSCDCCVSWAKEGASKSMAIFNSTKKSD